MSAGDNAIHVRADHLRKSQDFQEEQAARCSEITRALRSAALVGDAFGKVGLIAGLDDAYRGWAEAEAAALDLVSRMIHELADGLGMTADDYDGTDVMVSNRMQAIRDGQR